jgi:hypothetical protein
VQALLVRGNRPLGVCRAVNGCGELQLPGKSPSGEPLRPLTRWQCLRHDPGPMRNHQRRRPAPVSASLDIKGSQVRANEQRPGGVGAPAWRGAHAVARGAWQLGRRLLRAHPMAQVAMDRPRGLEPGRAAPRHAEPLPDCSSERPPLPDLQGHHSGCLAARVTARGRAIPSRAAPGARAGPARQRRALPAVCFTGAEQRSCGVM